MHDQQNKASKREREREKEEKIKRTLKSDKEAE